MVRTQIQLTEQQARFLRQQAHDDHVSMAELIRRYIEHGIAAAQARHDDLAASYARASRIVGSVKTLRGETDISVNHDRYLEEDFR